MTDKRNPPRDWRSVRARQQAYRQAYARYGTIQAAADELGVSRQAIAYAVNPVFAEKRRAQMRYNYYLKHILPKELEAESRELA